MKFLLHNEEGITFPPIRPAYEEGEILFERFRTLTPRDARDSIIGEGGTGLIHLVRDELMDRIVALKLPHENILRDPSARFDVIRETRQAIELTHPHIVRIHDFHEGKGGWAISMQYVRGKNLDEWRHEGRSGSRRSIVPYSVERIESWIAQLCEALIYAHEDASMVHRDIKPKNLMLERREDGREKLLLTDFGITQKLRLHTIMLSRVQPGTNEKNTMGTLPYMPWEQIQGAPASTLDDIYSVGATIYELLTGRPPFYEGAYEQIRTQVEKVVPPTMTRRLQDFDLAIHSIPDAWEETVAACLAKRPEDRPQSIREVMHRLGLAGAPVPVPLPVEPAIPIIDSAKTDALEEELRLREEEVRSLQDALAGRHQDIAALQQEVQDLTATVSSLEKSVETHRAAIGDAEGQSQLLATLQTELEAKSRELEEASGKAGQLQSHIASIGENLEAEEQHRKALETELADARAAADAATARVQEIEADAREQIEQARNALQAAAEEAAARIARIEASSQQQVEEARQVATHATEVAEKAARRRTAHALAEAIANAEAAKQQAAKLAEESSRHAAIAERAEQKLAALKSVVSGD